MEACLLVAAAVAGGGVALLACLVFVKISV